ncbi:MAG TPA: hypothetical protein VNT30_20060 [Stellaceae bacterium]|nr:hypothetical protein [Stellaceae bacterium]
MRDGVPVPLTWAAASWVLVGVVVAACSVDRDRVAAKLDEADVVWDVAADWFMVDRFVAVFVPVVAGDTCA